MLFGHLSHGHETTSAPASTASTTTPGPTTAASSRRRSPCAESATRALFAWPPAWRGIVNNIMANPAQPESNVSNESAAARLSGVLLYVLLHCCAAVLGRFVDGGWWVGGGWRSLVPRGGRVSSKNETSPVCFLFHSSSSTNN